ncbi:MAG: FtsX-like permease family protein [Nocardioides sp.]
MTAHQVGDPAVEGNGQPTSSLPGRPVNGPINGPVNGLGSWLGGWRVSLRMARRDMRRDKGRSLLIALMVLLPVTLISYLVTSTYSETGATSVANTLGGAQARVNSIDSNVVLQTDTEFAGVADKAARTIPGFTPRVDLTGRAAALSGLVDAPVVPQVVSRERAVLGDRKVPAIVQAVTSLKGLAPKVALLSGRWPASPAEVLVTPRGEHDGIPRSGSLTLSRDGVERQVEVVGTAIGRLDDEMASLVSVPPDQIDRNPADTGVEVTWLIGGDRPVTWSQVRTLNEYGLFVLSRAVLADPPSRNEFAPQLRELPATSNGLSGLGPFVVVSAVLLFFFAAVMVAPAFAVGAARQRRTLAVVASNGATTAQLRRSMLAQALLLGVGAAAVGVFLSVLIAGAQIALINHFVPWELPGRLRVPVIGLIGILAIAITTVVCSALMPATRLGRLDIVGVMRGQNVSPQASRRLPIVGLGLMGVGAVGVLAAFAVKGASLGLALGGIAALLGGAISVIPMALVVAANLASRAPLAIRMAARDAARHRPRAVPTVAAVMAGSAILTVAGIATSSNDAKARRDYQPQLPYGEMSLTADFQADPDGRELRENVAQYARGLNTYQVTQIGLQYDAAREGAAYREQLMLAVPAGCTAAQTLRSYERPDSPTCAYAGSHATVERGGRIVEPSITVLPVAQMIRLYDLDERGAEIVRAGGILSSDQLISKAGELRILSGSVAVTARGAYGKATTDSSQKVPVIPVSRAVARANGDQYAAMIVSAEAAQKHDWPTYPPNQRLYDPSGPISIATEEAITTRLPDSVVAVTERGYTPALRQIIVGFFIAAGLLMVVVTLLATALAVNEQQGDLATLASVGATRGTRRRMAAAQAALIAGGGSVLGIAIGLVPGVAFTFPITGTGFDKDGYEVVRDPVIVIPWLLLLGIVVVVPIVAAALAGVAIRRTPTVTHRTT